MMLNFVFNEQSYWDTFAEEARSAERLERIPEQNHFGNHLPHICPMKNDDRAR
jgi:hypothetical protein